MVPFLDVRDGSRPMRDGVNTKAPNPEAAQASGVDGSRVLIARHVLPGRTRLGPSRVQSFPSRPTPCTVAPADVVEAKLRAADDGSFDEVVTGGPALQPPAESLRTAASVLNGSAANPAKFGAGHGVVGQPLADAAPESGLPMVLPAILAAGRDAGAILAACTRLPCCGKPETGHDPKRAGARMPRVAVRA